MGKKVARSVTERRPVPQGRHGHTPSWPQSHLIPTAGHLSILEGCKGHKLTPALLASPFLGRGWRADNAGIALSGAGSPPSDPSVADGVMHFTCKEKQQYIY